MNTNENIKKCTPYHYQIKGSVYTVNFYPTKKTYYINGAVKGHYYKNVDDLINIANGKQEVETVSKETTHRKATYKKIKKSLMKNIKSCWICGINFNVTTEKITLEHKIPLSKGGSNRKDNLTLSCKECNHNRKNNIKK